MLPKTDPKKGGLRERLRNPGNFNEAMQWTLQCSEGGAARFTPKLSR
jgi:hypothetical protein